MKSDSRAKHKEWERVSEILEEMRKCEHLSQVMEERFIFREMQ
jgi:hypothetical protein